MTGTTVVERQRIPFHRPSIGGAERQAVLDVLDSGWLTTGDRTVAFEEAVRRAVDVEHAVGVNSATAALHLALEALSIGPGDEVIVPTYTFAACGEVVRYLGARPRLVDVDASSCNASAATIEPAIRPSTRAILVVHFSGLMADMDPILDLAERHSIPVVEDAAHALPAARNGRAAGSLGRAGALSFYATKTVTTGEGGMLVTNDARIAARARVMRLHGISRDAWRRYTAAGSWFYEIEEIGFKYNLTDLAAAIGLVQLGRAEAMRRERERVARRYDDELAARGLLEFVDPPLWPSDREVHAWHLYPVRLRLDRVARDRAAVIEAMASEGIGTSVHFIPLHVHPWYRRSYGYEPADLPIAWREYEREISLPIYPDLSDDEVRRVVDALEQAVREPVTSRGDR